MNDPRDPVELTRQRTKHGIRAFGSEPAPAPRDIGAALAQTVEFRLQNIAKQQIGGKASNQQLRLGEPRMDDRQHVGGAGVIAVIVRCGTPAFIAVPECAPRIREATRMARFPALLASVPAVAVHPANSNDKSDRRRATMRHPAISVTRSMEMTPATLKASPDVDALSFRVDHRDPLRRLGPRTRASRYDDTVGRQVLRCDVRDAGP